MEQCFFSLPICLYLAKNKNCLQDVYNSQVLQYNATSFFLRDFFFSSHLFSFAGHLPGFVLVTKRIPENPKKSGSTSRKLNKIYN